MQHATRYHTAKLEQALAVQGESVQMPVYVAAEDHHHRLPYSFPSSFFILPCQVKSTRKRNKICSSELIDA